MKSNILIINLNTTKDVVYNIPGFKENKIFRTEVASSFGGGKGVNVARVLNKFKINNKVIGFVGGFNKKFILHTLKKEKINFIPINIKGESRVCTIIINNKNKKLSETVINEKGPIINEKERKKFLKIFIKEIKKVKYLIISGSVPQGIPSSFYHHLILIASTYNVKSILDTSGKSLKEAINAKPYILKVNISEIKDIFKNISSEKILIKLKKKGIKYPVITLGKKGILYINERNKIIKSPPYNNKNILIDKNKKMVTTIGCGDSFTAGIIFYLMKYKNDLKIEKALHLASIFSYLNTFEIGSGVLPDFNLNIIKKFL